MTRRQPNLKTWLRRAIVGVYTDRALAEEYAERLRKNEGRKVRLYRRTASAEGMSVGITVVVADVGEVL